MLKFERRQPIIPIILLDDVDIQLLHGKGIKRRLLVLPSEWNTSGVCLVPVWEIIEANRCENPAVFLQSSMAIDLHEGSMLIAQGKITTSIA